MGRWVLSLLWCRAVPRTNGWSLQNFAAQQNNTAELWELKFQVQQSWVQISAPLFTSFHESQVGFVQLQPELRSFINIGVSHYRCIRQLWNWILFPRDSSTTRNTHSLSSPPHQMTISVRQWVGTAPATTHVLDTPSLSSTSTIGKNSDFWSASKSHFHRPDLEV